MTKQERQKIIKAIGFFLDEDPDKWINGVDELCLLVYNKKYSDSFQTGNEFITIADLWRRENSNE